MVCSVGLTRGRLTTALPPCNVIYLSATSGLGLLPVHPKRIGCARNFGARTYGEDGEQDLLSLVAMNVLPYVTPAVDHAWFQSKTGCTSTVDQVRSRE